jgi:uncharacterized protein (TIGR03905 family)
MTIPHSLTGVGGLFNSRIMRTLIHHIGLLAGIQEQNKTVLRGKEMSVLHRIPQAWLLIEDGIIKSVSIVGGCNGNLKAITKLCDGMTVEQIEDKLKGNLCGRRPTSCADQLAKAVREAYEAQKNA